MRYIAVLLSALALAGCSATAYKDGYGDSQLSPTVFKINSIANGFSDIGREDDIAMLRAAEIACIKGYRYFDVLNEERWQERKMSYKYMTIQLKGGYGQYDAKVIMQSLKEYLQTDIECRF